MRFRPGLWPSLLLIPLALVFVRLAIWQFDREQQKANLIQQFQNADGIRWPAVGPDSDRFSRVNGRGRFDAAHSVLLDNQPFAGRNGVHVYTPFRFEDGRYALVNRGWLPLPADRRLPAFDTPINEITITGILNRPPEVGLRLGNARPLNSAQWPNLVTYLELPLISDALGYSVSAWVVQLTGEHPAGFDGQQWSPVNFGPDKHRAYAIQWLALASTVAVVYVLIAIRRKPSTQEPDNTDD